MFKAIKNCKHIAFLTGAGISVASGIPTFRGKGGFWTKDGNEYEATKLLTNHFLKEKPELVWGWH